MRLLQILFDGSIENKNEVNKLNNIDTVLLYRILIALKEHFCYLEFTHCNKHMFTLNIYLHIHLESYFNLKMIKCFYKHSK